MWPRRIEIYRKIAPVVRLGTRLARSRSPIRLTLLHFIEHARVMHVTSVFHFVGGLLLVMSGHGNHLTAESDVVEVHKRCV